jgi:hypothetical protein
MEHARFRRARRFPLRLIAAAAGLAMPATASEAATMSQERHTTPLPPPRDGNAAIAEELEAARRAGTIAAYDLFLARHPTHRLARTARRERRLIAARRPLQPM